MKARFLALTLGALVISILTAPSAQAQASGSIRITRIDFNSLLSPKYQDQTTPYARRTDNWLQIMIRYEADGGRDGWIDQLTLDWSVGITPPRGKPLLLKKRVVYADVEAGRQHAVMYIRPNLMKRLFGRDRIDERNIFVYIQVSVNGSPAGTFHHAKGQSPRNWWEAAEPNVVVRGDELLARTETPFAPMDYDFYQHIKIVE